MWLRGFLSPRYAIMIWILTSPDIQNDSHVTTCIPRYNPTIFRSTSLAKQALFGYTTVNKFTWMDQNLEKNMHIICACIYVYTVNICIYTHTYIYIRYYIYRYLCGWWTSINPTRSRHQLISHHPPLVDWSPMPYWKSKKKKVHINPKILLW